MDYFIRELIYSVRACVKTSLDVRRSERKKIILVYYNWSIFKADKKNYEILYKS